MKTIRQVDIPLVVYYACPVAYEITLPRYEIPAFYTRAFLELHRLLDFWGQNILGDRVEPLLFYGFDSAKHFYIMLYRYLYIGLCRSS